MNSTPTVAAVIIARNEAGNIQRCLDSVGWCSARIVVDDGSTDGTVEAALRCGARVIGHRFESFARQRNWAIENADIGQDWLLMLDADEVSTPEFAEAVMSSISGVTPETVAFRTCRKTMFLGRWLKYSDGFPVWIMRIVRRGQPLFQDSGHGEIPVPQVSGIGTIKEPFLHFPFSKGLRDWLERHNRYSTREAEWEAANRPRSRFVELFSGDGSIRRKALRNFGRRMPGRPFLRFAYQYGAKLGFLDGRPGFVFSALMAYYEWLIKLKRREIELRTQGVEL